MIRSATTPEEVTRVYERLYAYNPARASEWLAGKAKRYPEAASAALKAHKKAVKRARESTEISRMVLESLTAAQAPQPAPGASLAPAAMTPDDLVAEYFATAATETRAPFWRATAAVDNANVPEPAKPLHQMDADEFRAYAADALTAYGNASGFGSPRVAGQLASVVRKSFAAALANAINPPEIDVFGQLGYQPACVPYIAGQVTEPCGQCPQEQFATADEFSVLLGGSAGGGKTLSLLMYALRACVQHPGIRVGAFRRSYPELRESLLAELAQYGYAEALGATWNGTEYELRFPSGSLIAFRYAESLKDASRRQGAAYQLLCLDERTLFPGEVVAFLESRVRSGRTTIPVLGIRSSANPGGPGHAAVKRDFIDSTGYGEHVHTDKRGRTVRFIPAGLQHNPYINPEYAADLRNLPEALRKAFLDGDWDSFAGAMFPELDRERHVVRPFSLPSAWRRIAGVDWGYRAPWAVIHMAEDEDGRLWLYREIYETGVGEAEQARRILEAEGDEQVTRYADDAMWATRGDAKPIADVYAGEGCHLTPAGKGPGSRIAGWQRIRSYLADAPACPHHRALGWETCPRLHAFSTLTNWWREMTGLPHAATGNPEDADTRAPDHLADATRYALAALGTGPEFVILDPPAGAGGENMFGHEVMRQAGAFAYRIAPDDAWAQADSGDDDERRNARTVRQAPWA